MFRGPTLAVLLSFGLIAPASADFQDGIVAFERRDYVTAYREFLPLARQGNAPAQYYVGAMYWTGHVVERDRAEALG